MMSKHWLTSWILAASVAGGANAQPSPLYVGQVAPLSGPAASIGLPVTQAAHAYFKRVNQNGGIAGRQIVLLDRDDGFKPDRTMTAVKQLLAERQLIALINIIGAPNNGDLVTSGLLPGEGVPVIGAFTGSTSVRSLKSPHLFFVRASVESEAQKMVSQIRTIGMSRIGLVHANDAFGQDAKEHVESALRKQKGEFAGSASYEPATSDVSSAVSQMIQAAPQAIIFFGTAPAAARFVVDYRKQGGGAMIIANSSTSPDALVKLAGTQYARGVGLVQVTPSLAKITVPVVQEYLDTLKRFGDPTWTPSTYGLEGFLAAKVLAEGLRRSGAAPTRQKLMNALDQLGRFDAGGVILDYRSGSREGLKTVDIGIVGSSGRLVN